MAGDPDSWNIYISDGVHETNDMYKRMTDTQWATFRRRCIEKRFVAGKGLSKEEKKAVMLNAPTQQDVEDFLNMIEES